VPKKRVEALYAALTPEQQTEFADVFLFAREMTYEDVASRFALDGDNLKFLRTNRSVDLGKYTTSCVSFTIEGRQKYLKIPRLVGILKAGRLLVPGEQVDHLNHDPADNRPSNLRVVTVAENMRYRRPTNGLPPGVSVILKSLKNGSCIYIQAAVRATRALKIVSLRSDPIRLSLDASFEEIEKQIKVAARFAEEFHLRLGYGTQSLYLTGKFKIDEWQLTPEEYIRWTKSSSSTPKLPDLSSNDTLPTTPDNPGLSLSPP